MFCKSIAESLIQLLTSRLNMLVHVQSVFKILHLMCSLCFSWRRTSSVSCEEFAVRTVPSLDCEKRFVHFAYVSLTRRLKNRSSAVIGQFDYLAEGCGFVLFIRSVNGMSCQVIHYEPVVVNMVHGNLIAYVDFATSCSSFMFCQCLTVTDSIR